MPKVAFLTSGGIAPCLSASIGGLIEKYNELEPNIEMVGYMHGYRGLLLGKSVIFSKEVKKIPVTSGPYIISDFNIGKNITYIRNKSY